MRKLFTLSFVLLLSMGLKAQDLVNVTFYTAQGEMKAEIYPGLVPVTANNFLDLVEKKFYDRCHWHRVIKDFIIQTGDHTTNGQQAAGSIPLEIHPSLRHDQAGILTMARYEDPNSATSQFSVTLGPAPHLDDQYAVFGKVVEGIEVAHQIGAVPVNTGAWHRPYTDIWIDSIRVDANDPTATVAINAEDIRLFPNPADEILNMEFPSGTVSKVEVVNIHGQVALTQLPLLDDNRISLQTSALRAGMYLIRMHTEGEILYRKVLIK